MQGADGVMVLGCHIGDCHYGNGNHRTAKRFPVYHELMDYMGIDRDRLWVQWVSASEGQQFAEIVDSFTTEIGELGPSPYA